MSESDSTGGRDLYDNPEQGKKNLKKKGLNLSGLLGGAKKVLEDNYRIEEKTINHDPEIYSIHLNRKIYRR